MSLRFIEPDTDASPESPKAPSASEDAGAQTSLATGGTPTTGPSGVSMASGDRDSLSAHLIINVAPDADAPKGSSADVRGRRQTSASRGRSMASKGSPDAILHPTYVPGGFVPRSWREAADGSTPISSTSSSSSSTSSANGKTRHEKRIASKNALIGIPGHTEVSPPIGLDTPKNPHGILCPKKLPTNAWKKVCVFRSRVLFLLLLQLVFYAIAWALDHFVFRLAWSTILHCGYISVFFIPVIFYGLYKMRRISPLNYFFICMYIFFSLPYFFTITRILEPLFIFQYFTLYGTSLFIALLSTYMLSRRISTFYRVFFVCLVAMTIESLVFYTLVRNQSTVIHIIHYATFHVANAAIPSFYFIISCFYLSVCTVGIVLYYIYKPGEHYNYLDYCVAFIDLNLFVTLCTVRRKHFCLFVFIIVSVLLFLVLDKILYIQSLFAT